MNGINGSELREQRLQTEICRRYHADLLNRIETESITSDLKINPENIKIMIVDRSNSSPRKDALHRFQIVGYIM